MENNPINKYTDETIDEWIDHLPYNLEQDAECLIAIFPGGEDSFGLSGSDLEEFAYRCFIKMLEAGAYPAWPSRGGLDSGHEISRQQ